MWWAKSILCFNASFRGKSTFNAVINLMNSLGSSARFVSKYYTLRPCWPSFWGHVSCMVTRACSLPLSLAVRVRACVCLPLDSSLLSMPIELGPAPLSTIPPWKRRSVAFHTTVPTTEFAFPSFSISCLLICQRPTASEPRISD